MSTNPFGAVNWGDGVFVDPSTNGGGTGGAGDCLKHSQKEIEEALTSKNGRVVSPGGTGFSLTLSLFPLLQRRGASFSSGVALSIGTACGLQSSDSIWVDL